MGGSAWGDARFPPNPPMLFQPPYSCSPHTLAAPPLQPPLAAPPCLFRELPILEMIGNCYVIKIPRIIATL